MKMTFFGLCALLLVISQAHATCNDMKVLKKAAEKSYKKSEQPFAGNPSFEGRTRTGKDKWSVPVNVNEECLSGVIIYTKADKCDVLSVINLGLGDGACG